MIGLTEPTVTNWTVGFMFCAFIGGVVGWLAGVGLAGTAARHSKMVRYCVPAVVAGVGVGVGVWWLLFTAAWEDYRRFIR